MPTHFQHGQAPVVHFNPLLEVSPFTLFRRLRDGREVLLYDARAELSELTLAGAVALPKGDWQPVADKDVILFDEDGSEALPIVEKLQARGFSRVKILFGGLKLYEFSLDPEVVGTETFLVRRQ